MDLDCVGPEGECTLLMSKAEEIVERESPEARERIELLRRYWRRWRPSFVEFFIISWLDIFHPKTKESIWWEPYPQEKRSVVEGLKEVGEHGEEHG